MAVELVVGTTNEGASSGVSNVHYLQTFTAIASASNVTRFDLYSLGIGNVKINIYDDDGAGNPNNLIASNDAGQGIVSGWNTLTISSCSIVSTNKYHVGVVCDTSSRLARADSSGNGWYLTGQTYSTYTSADPIVASYTAHTYLFSFAIYGETGGGVGNNISDVFGKLNNSILLGGLIK